MLLLAEPASRRAARLRLAALAAVAALTAASLAGAGVEASRAEPGVVFSTLAELVEQSDAVVIGRPLRTRRYLTAGGSVRTDHTILVQLVLKGRIRNGRRMVVAVPGGAYEIRGRRFVTDRRSETRPVDPQSSYAFFLTAAEGAGKRYTLTGGAQGMFQLQGGQVVPMSRRQRHGPQGKKVFPDDVCEVGEPRAAFLEEVRAASAGRPYLPPGPAIVVDVSGDGVFLTDRAGGVAFALGSGSLVYETAWTEHGSDDAWLVLDRNGNGKIDNGTELFGSHAPQSPPGRGRKGNGFSVLAAYDRPEQGGNRDGRIGRGDVIFEALRLWQDTDHDGVSQPSELQTLPALGVEAIAVSYEPTSQVDGSQNEFRHRAKVVRQGGQGSWAFDVSLASGRMPR